MKFGSVIHQMAVFHEDEILGTVRNSAISRHRKHVSKSGLCVIEMNNNVEKACSIMASDSRSVLHIQAPETCQRTQRSKDKKQQQLDKYTRVVRPQKHCEES